MLGERVLRLALNATYMGILYMILLQDDCEYTDVRIGGKVSHPLYFKNYPCQKIPANLDNFYVFKLSYHSFELVFALLHQRSRIDFPEYFLHHFLTLTLILFSYSLNMITIGSIVMILHDVTDFGMSIFKMTVDITPFIVQVLGYACMCIPWIYLRLWFFPMHVISRIFEEVYDYSLPEANYSVLANNIGMMVGFLMILCVLHIFWFYLMIKGFIKRLQNMSSISLGSSENKQ